MYDHEKAERVVSGNYCKALPQRTMLDEGTLLDKYLYSRELSPTLAKQNGWYLSRHAGDWNDRVVIPAQSEIKDLKFWQARYIGSDPTIKRYQSPPGPRMDALVVVYPDGVPTYAVVVEGPLDGLAAAGEGALGIGLMGATPSVLVLDYLAKRCQGLKTVVVADNDAMDKATMIIAELFDRDIAATLCTPPEPYKALAEMPKELRNVWTKS